MALLVLAYPKISNEDYSFIQEIRRNHDELYFSFVEPHFTLVFPVSSISEQEFIEEVKQRAEGFSSIPFELKCAVVNKDSFINYYHTFLVPDTGFSSMVKLHDKLYSGKLQKELRLDIQFLPHLGIASSESPERCKLICDDINAEDISIQGEIDYLDIVSFDKQSLLPLESIPLGEE